MPELEALGPEDAQILALEEGPIAGHTMKIAVLARPVALEQVRARVAERAEPGSRLRLRLAPSAGAPAWEEDPEFDAARQVRPAGGGGDLATLAGGLMGERLPRDRPLWCVDVAELPDGRGALFWRVHHALADGTAVMRLGDQLLWDTTDDAGVLGRARDEERATGGLRGLIRELRPAHELRALAVPVGQERRAAFASAPIARLKAAERAAGAGATVNDVVLAATAGAIRGWLDRRHEPIRDVRVKVPVSMHRPGESPHASANRDSCLFVDLPLSEPDPIERIRRVAGETRQRKAAHDADALYVLMHGSSPVSRLARRAATDPHEFAIEISNVPGPRQPRSFLDVPVQAFFTLAEIGRRHALRVAAVSLAGDMHIGLCVDAAAIPDVDALGDGLAAELEGLAAATG